MRTLWNGAVAPEVGDDLLDAWPEMVDSVGRIIPVNSVADARLLLDAAETSGVIPSVSKPVVFMLPGGIIYQCSGKNYLGNWVLGPANPAELVSDTYEVTWTGRKSFTVAGGATSQMMKTSLPPATYDRRVTASAFVFGNVTAGDVNLLLTMHDGSLFYSRFPSQDSTVGASGDCIIPAGQTPNITVKIHGGGGAGGTISLSSNENQNRLSVSADPYTMA